MPIRKQDTFYAASIDQKITVIDFLPGGKIKVKFERAGHSDEGEITADKIQYLINPDLYQKL